MSEQQQSIKIAISIRNIDKKIYFSPLFRDILYKYSQYSKTVTDVRTRTATVKQ